MKKILLIMFLMSFSSNANSAEFGGWMKMNQSVTYLLSSGYKIKSEVVDVPNKKTSRYPNFEDDLNSVHYKRIRRRHIPKKPVESPLNNIWLNAMCDKSVDQEATINATFGVCQHKNTGVLMRQHNTKDKCDNAGGSWESADTKPYWRPYGCCAHGDCEGGGCS